MAQQSPHIDIEALLAAGSLILFGAVTGAVLYHVVPDKNEKYAMLLLGALIGVVKDCFARYFSATKAASLQRETIADMAKASATTAAVVAATAPPTVAQLEGEVTIGGAAS